MFPCSEASPMRVVGSALVSEIERATSSGAAPVAATEAAATALAARVRSLKEAARRGLSRREVAT
jgi:hypothetical protein